MAYEEDDRRKHTGHYTYRTTKETPRKRTGLLVTLVSLALITGVVSWAVNFMDLQVKLEDRNLTVTLGKKEKQQEQMPQVQPVRETVQKQEADETQNGVRISSTPYSEENYPAQEESVLSLQQIYEKTAPSVVSVSCAGPEGTVEGIGVIMTADGYVITNCHVVAKAQRICVTVDEKGRYDAVLVGEDEFTDLAVLKIEGEDLSPAEFGDSDMLRVGDAVVSIGEPPGAGMHGAMTEGIVSAIDRDLDVSGRRMSLIQTDAVIDSEKPGRLLINCYGQIVGIGTAKLHGFGGEPMDGPDMIIPIVQAKPILDELMEQGYLSGSPAIGIRGQTIDMHVQLFYHIPAGVAVTSVVEHSGAHAAGIRLNDVIVAFDGTPIASLNDLLLAKDAYETGDVVSLTIFRHDRYYTAEVELMDQLRPDIY